MRSRTGCLTCRHRKLKCDEVKPICGQCQKASRQCQPNTGLTFRHQHNASMNAGPPQSDDDANAPQAPHLNGFYAYKNTFGRDVHWVDIPRDLTFCHTTDPYAEPAGRIDGEVPEIGGAGFLRPEDWRGAQGAKSGNRDGGDPGMEGLNTNGLEALSAAALSASPQARGSSFPYAGQHPNSRLQGATHGKLPSQQGDHDDYGISAAPAPPLDPSIDPSLTLGHQVDASLSSHGPAQHHEPASSSGVLDQTQLNGDVEGKIETLLRGINSSANYWVERPSSKDEDG